MAAIDDAVRVHTALAQQQDKKLAGAAAQLAGGPPQLQQTYGNGTHVLDLVTGQTGVVISGKRENVIIPLAAEPSAGDVDDPAV